MSTLHAQGQWLRTPVLSPAPVDRNGAYHAVHFDNLWPDRTEAARSKPERDGFITESESKCRVAANGRPHSDQLVVRCRHNLCIPNAMLDEKPAAQDGMARFAVLGIHLSSLG